MQDPVPNSGQPNTSWEAHNKQSTEAINISLSVSTRIQKIFTLIISFLPLILEAMHNHHQWWLVPIGTGRV